jgi:Bacterial transcriptional regulator
VGQIGLSTSTSGRAYSPRNTGRRFSRSGRVLAALSVSGPVDRFRSKDIERHAPHLLRAGREISLELGRRET